jgi:hypothetical protein
MAESEDTIEDTFNTVVDRARDASLYLLSASRFERFAAVFELFNKVVYAVYSVAAAPMSAIFVERRLAFAFASSVV